MSERQRQVGDYIGDYRLVRAVSDGQLTRTWEGEQVSMQRSVMIEILRQAAMADPEIVSSFIGDVRAKALVRHPGIGTVYEAVTNDEAAFFAREKMAGVGLDALCQEGARFSPLETVVLLGQLAEAMKHLEAEGVATIDYELYHFVVDGRDHARVMNLAIDDPRDPEVDTRTKHLLGGVFRDMLQTGQPGSTRVRSLCDFMTDATRPIPLTWTQIVDLCEQVRSQLQGSAQVAAPGPSVAAVPAVKIPQPVKVPASVWALLGGLALIGVVIAVLVSSSKSSSTPAAETPAQVSPFIEIPAASYPDSLVITQPVMMSRTEVTLAQYSEFLADPKHHDFAHPDQPDEKVSHEPDEWNTLWPAAVKNQRWRGRKMSIRFPVVGVDWWDAYAYANWARGRLPTLTEWAIAAKLGKAPASPMKWNAVDQDTPDVTGRGLVGMAGNVREWLGEPEVNPATPLAPKAYLAAGSSFKNPNKGIEARSWVDSRSFRARDLGFRILTEN